MAMAKGAAGSTWAILLAFGIPIFSKTIARPRILQPQTAPPMRESASPEVRHISSGKAQLLMALSTFGD